MKVRFGFVAMALSLKNASPSQTMTVKTFQGIADREAALRKATRIAESNLHNTLRILRHAHASGIHVYRFSSRLIPLFGHPDTLDWDFIGHLQDPFRAIGEFVQEHSIRVSFHPDHFTLLNAPKQETTDSSIGILNNHVRMFEAMGLDETAKLVIHVGGAYRNKEASMRRFAENWRQVPDAVRQRLTLENDDRSFTAREAQSLCAEVKIPNVLDVHHHRCNHEEGVSFPDLVEAFLASWEKTGLPPKAHVSSPKSEKDIRAHADFVRPEDLLPFLDAVRDHDTDIDVMLEAKQKDEAVFALMAKLTKYSFVRALEGGVVDYRP